MYSINNSTNHNKTKLNQQKPSLGNRCFPVQTGLARCIECIHNGTRRAYTPGQQGWSVDCLQRKPNMLWREERLLTLLSCRNLEIPDKLKCKVKQSLNRPGQALVFPGSWDSQILRHSVVRLSAIWTSCLYPTRSMPGTHFCQRLSRRQIHSAARRIMWLYEVCSNSIWIGNVVLVHWVGWVYNQSWHVHTRLSNSWRKLQVVAFAQLPVVGRGSNVRLCHSDFYDVWKYQTMHFHQFLFSDRKNRNRIVSIIAASIQWKCNGS